MGGFCFLWCPVNVGRYDDAFLVFGTDINELKKAEERAT